MEYSVPLTDKQDFGLLMSPKIDSKRNTASRRIHLVSQTWHSSPLMNM